MCLLCAVIRNAFKLKYQYQPVVLHCCESASLAISSSILSEPVFDLSISSDFATDPYHNISNMARKKNPVSPRTKEAAELLRDNPKLKTQHAMRAAKFNDHEISNNSIQRRVHRRRRSAEMLGKRLGLLH